MHRLISKKPTSSPNVLNVTTFCSQRALSFRKLLQGFRGPKQRDRLIEHFSTLPLIVPDLRDHIEAATLQTICRRKGIQITTIDALLAQLAIAHDLEFLTTDRDFSLISRHVPLRILTNR